MVVVIVLLLFKTCQYIKDKDNLLDQMGDLRIREQYFTKKVQDDSSTIATQNQNILTQNEAIKLKLLTLEDGMKKVQSQVSQTQDVIVKKVLVPYVPNNYVDTSLWMKRLKRGEVSRELIDSLMYHSVLVPSKFQKKEKWFDISGQVRKEGVLIDSLQMKNESTITIGWKKSGFLNLGSKRVVDIKNTNPYFDVTKMNNVVVKEKNGILRNKFFWLGVGIISGIVVQSKL